MSERRWPLALLFGLLLLGGWARRAHAEEPWEAEVRREEAEEDRLIQQARARGPTATGQVVGRYASRAGRQPTALNLYLLGRAHYYHGDAAAAERNLRQALQREPGFWFAHLKLAVLFLEQKHPEEAERELQIVLQMRPGEEDALRLLARIRMERKDWTGALRVLEDLLSRNPGDDEIRQTIAFVHVSREDWASALNELRVLRGRMPRDPGIRWYHARALYETGDLEHAARELEAIVRDEGADPRPLDMLRVIYTKQRDLPALKRTLQRLLPLVEDEEFRAQLLKMLEQVERLEKAPTLPEGVAEGERPSEEAVWAAHVERCQDPDPGVRREALQAYFEARYPVMPSVLIRRVHAGIEPDPACRAWVLRIIGGLANGQLAQVAAFGLYDPDVMVRCIAAECIGELGTPSGLLYLLPFLVGDGVDGPMTEDAVREFNAARAAFILLTAHADPAGDESAWVDAAHVREVRAHWQAWLVGPEGRQARLAAIRDLGVRGDLRPELHLMDDVLGPDAEIAIAAWQVLRDRAAQPPEDEQDRQLWAPFPATTAGEVTPETWPPVREAVRAWWETWLEARRVQRAEAAAGGGRDG